MIILSKFGILSLQLLVYALLLSTNSLYAQNNQAYQGYRLALMNLEIRQQTATSIAIRCDVANTGRLPLDFNRNTPAPPALLLEYDTVALPLVLRGRTSWLDSIIRHQKVKLSPGNIQYGLRFQIPIKPSYIQADTLDLLEGACPDLVFDSIYLVKYTAKSMVLRYIIRNEGSSTAKLFGNGSDKKDRMSLNVYFVSGVRLTRGAIFAGTSQIQDGPEIPNGLLAPGQLMQGEITLSLKNRTKFSPNLVLELDPFQTIPECRRVNNTKTLIVEY